MRAANDGSGTTVTTGETSVASTGRSGRGSSTTGGSATFAVRLRAGDLVLRVEGFLPCAVVDRFFVTTGSRHITPDPGPHGPSWGVDSP
jgi:hypothetical protein